MRFIKAFGIILFLLPLTVSAQKISASVDKDVIAEGDNFQLTITLKNGDGDIAFPDLRNFDVLMGPSQTSRVKNINGSVQKIYSLSWYLRPKRKGDFVIKPIDKSGDYYFTPIKIKVIEGIATKENVNKAPPDKAEDHFARIYISNDNPYVGDQVVATYIIYNSIRGFSPSPELSHKFEGFWKEELEIEAQWSQELERINGRNYQKAVIAKQILIPQKSGELKIEAFTVNGRIDRGFGRYNKVNFKSNEVLVNVKALPPYSDDDYNGAVGTFDIDLDIDKGEVSKDEAINLKLTISGKGNLSLINEIPIAFPNDFEVYDQGVKDNISKSGGGLTGSRSFEYLIIPRYPGNYEIDPISFAYFNTKRKEYIKWTSDPIIIDVLKGSGESVAKGPSVIRKEDVNILEDDIRYISLSTKLEKKGTFFFASPGYMAGVLSPAFAFLALIAFRRKRQKEKEDVIGSKKKRAARQASKKLQAAREALKSNEESLFFEQLHIGLSNYLSDKINLSTSEFRKDSLEEVLIQHSASDTATREFIELLEQCEIARYAPSAATQPNEMLSRGEAVIKALEEELL